MRVRMEVAEAVILERERADAARLVETEPVTAVMMRRVFNQLAESDRGPGEQRLREWLVKDVKGYLSACEEKEEREAGVAELRARLAAAEAELFEVRAAAVEVKPAGVDEGTARARALLVKRILAGPPEGYRP